MPFNMYLSHMYQMYFSGLRVRWTLPALEVMELYVSKVNNHTYPFNVFKTCLIAVTVALKIKIWYGLYFMAALENV